MKGFIRHFFVLVLSLAVVSCLSMAVSAASSSSDYSVKVADKSISFIRNGQTVGTHVSRDGNITIVTAPSGSLGLCYYTTDNRYVRVALGNQTSLDITGTMPSLTLDKTLNSNVKVILGSSSSVTNMKINSKNKVTIGGKITNLTVSAGASVSVVSGASVTTAKVSSSQATLTAATGSTVKKVTAVSGASVSGNGIQSSNSTGNGSSGGTSTKNVTLSATDGDTLNDLSEDLNKKVKIYDDEGYRIIGVAEWDNSGKTEVRDGNTYNYTFYPNNSKYNEVSGTAKINVSGGSSRNSSSSSSNSDSRTLRLDVATIYDKSSSARLRDLEDYLDEAVVAYNNHDSQIPGRAEWISDTSTSVRSGQSYSFIFVPNDNTYDSARGTVKIELSSKSSGVGGGQITLAAFTLEADYRDYLNDLKSQLQENVRAYNSSGSRVSGTARWISSDTRLTVTGTYRFEFVPDNSRYETAKGDIKVFVSGSGTSGGSSSNNSSNSSSSSKSLTLEIDDIRTYSTNNTLRDLTSDLKDAVVARNSNGSQIDGTVKWVDSTNQKVRSTGEYRFRFIPDDTNYSEKQDWVKIVIR